MIPTHFVDRMSKTLSGWLEGEGMRSRDDGLFHKYDVARTDGKPVEWCFVLEDKDPLAVVALDAYAQVARAAGFLALADDLRERVAELGEAHGLKFPSHRCGKPDLDLFALADVAVGVPDVVRRLAARQALSPPMDK